jgi:hypothetical protein
MAQNEITEREISDLLELVIDAASDGMLDDAVSGELDDFHGARTRSFENDVLTGNSGFTIRMAGGAEFQITIVRSR